MIRKIIKIDQEKCNGCGLCIDACHEGALQLVDGKAVLISDEYCDGLGDCLPECPTGAIEIIEREAAAYDDELVKARLAASATTKVNLGESERPSELRQWPVQLNLINPQAQYLQNADLLIAADCTAYAYASFHEKFMPGRITLIGCPKLDDNDYYTEKIAEIIRRNNPNSIKVVRMDVPCCNGIVRAVQGAMLRAQTVVPYSEVTINSQGEIVAQR